MFDDFKKLEVDLLIGSTLVEGSTLTDEEAREVLAGRTVSGHPVHEIRELVSYRRAVEWLGRQLEAAPYLSHDLVENFHRVLMSGEPDAGHYKTHENYTMRLDGKRHSFVAPEHVREALDAWLLLFNTPPAHRGFEALLEQAARLYCGFENIHPFADGNGRIGRVFLAYWLYRHGGLRLRFYVKDKRAHLEVLLAANDGNLGLLVDFLRQGVEPPDEST